MSLGLAAYAQDDRKPISTATPLAGKAGLPIHDILVPVDAAGKPDGESPLAYVSAGLLAQLRRAAQTTALPPYLIGSAAFDGRVEASNQFVVLARFDVHVLARDPVVRVHLPVGSVNLGGANAACLVDGQPHPVIAAAQGAGLLLDLPGVPPVAVVPNVPESEQSPQPDGQSRERRGVVESEPIDEPIQARTYRVELRLQPPIDAGRSDTSSAFVTVPPGCQTQATISAAIDLPVLGVIPVDAARSVASQRQPADGRPLIRAAPVRPDRNRPEGASNSDTHREGVHPVRILGGPASKLMFFWSAVPETKPQPAAELQAGISCLADFSPSLIHLQYHIAYHLQSGVVDSLVWRVPAGYVLQSVQAPQLAGFRFQATVRSTAGVKCCWSFPVHSKMTSRSRPRLCCRLIESSTRFRCTCSILCVPKTRWRKHVCCAIIKLHSDIRRTCGVNISCPLSPALDQILKPRPIKEFLKEWNAAGARSQQAFDLPAQHFTLQVDLESLPNQPSCGGSSEGRFRPGRLDWTYTAEIEQPQTGQFVYRLHVDPRLKIRTRYRFSKMAPSGGCAGHRCARRSCCC